MTIGTSADQEEKWRLAARLSGFSLEDWAGRHLDICAALALAAAEGCELCSEHLADAPDSTCAPGLREPGAR